MNSTMEIRKPSQHELEEVLRLSPQSMFDGTLGRVTPTEEKIRQMVEPLLQKGAYYLLATEGDQIAGWILIGPSKDQFTDKIIGFIYELYVADAFRGRGISKELMKNGIDHLKQDGYSEIRLSVFAENHAVKLYEQMGFQVRTIAMSLPLE
jgi:ribosomal protein S18 acetylase RimI-like enzyme